MPDVFGARLIDRPSAREYALEDALAVTRCRNLTG